MRAAPRSSYDAGDPLPCCGCALSFGLCDTAELCVCSCHFTHAFFLRAPSPFRSHQQGEQ